MNESVGFMITVDPAAPGEVRIVGLQLHGDKEGEHYYGALKMSITDHWAGRPSVHQVTGTLVSIIGELGRMSPEEFQKIMQPVERPF
jgi:hypothetical protein